jgi:hypothetical protein
MVLPRPQVPAFPVIAPLSLQCRPFNAQAWLTNLVLSVNLQQVRKYSISVSLDEWRS